ncbi:MAG: DUF362 domain-containing protein [Candidatus Hydrothermarchaeales archaeon]
MDVYFASARVREFRKWWLPEESLVQKMEKLFFSARLNKLVSKGDNVGLKLHVGEPGNVHYLRPIYASKLVDILKELGGRVSVIETSGLGTVPGRTSVAKHLEAARKNGFCETTLGAPFVMVDGEDGLDSVDVKGIPVARGIVELDLLIVLSHVTGHIQAGFGGALKNLGVGCVSKAGKFRVHHKDRPRIDKKLCNVCRECISICPAGAISEELEIGGACVLCGSCVDVCEKEAIKTELNPRRELSKRIGENAAGVARAISNKAGYINLLMDVIPHCDCHPHSDIPIVPDIGILVSSDPVAIDQASIDLVNSTLGVVGSEAEATNAMAAGADKFELINPGTDWQMQLKTAEELGLGRREYRLKED